MLIQIYGVIFYRGQSKPFTAGAIFEGDKCVRTAPILWKLRGMTKGEARKFIAENAWKAIVVQVK